MLKLKEGARIQSRGSDFGEATGGGYHCRMEGCRGWRIGVRWRGMYGETHVTFPCVKGMVFKTDDEGRVVRGRIL